MEPKFRLPLNLQFFAEENNEEDNDQQENEQDENTTEGETGQDDKQAESKSFTQEDIDRIVKERLDREKKKRDEAVQQERDASERKRLAENEEYKELAAKLQEQLDSISVDALKVKKEALLIGAGYTEDQVTKYSKYVEGTSEEEIKQSVEALKSDVPPKPSYADPSANNGQKKEPKKTGLEDKGKSMYQRLKGKGKIRR